MVGYTAWNAAVPSNDQAVKPSGGLSAASLPRPPGSRSWAFETIRASITSRKSDVANPMSCGQHDDFSDVPAGTLTPRGRDSVLRQVRRVDSARLNRVAENGRTSTMHSSARAFLSSYCECITYRILDDRPCTAKMRACGLRERVLVSSELRASSWRRRPWPPLIPNSFTNT